MKPAKPRRVCLASSATLKADVRQEENEMIRSGPISKANRIAAWILAAIRTVSSGEHLSSGFPPAGARRATLHARRGTIGHGAGGPIRTLAR